MMTGLLLITLIARTAFCAAPLPAELEEAQHWAAAKFAGSAEESLAQAGIQVLVNNDPVQMNARNGRPLKIADREYTRGLYCHAVSRVMVYLPGPGNRFEAVAGVDSNEQTSGGRGSVVFSVKAHDKTVWKSELMREGMAGVPVEVDLGGARVFTLTVREGGDGISCDQADWADARVLLEDGSEVWLGDMQQLGAQRAPYDTDPFFSFTYGGKPSEEFLSSWSLERESVALDGLRTQHLITYTDPDTRLAVRCSGIAYADFPVVEWTLYFKNGGDKDTPVISDIRAIDTHFERNGTEEFVLHRHKGDNCTADSFEPVDEPLAPGAQRRIANTGGRPTQTEFPYFNIAGGKEGLIFVVSWAGQWAAEFVRDEDNGLTLRAGQETTRFKLLPGEEVRTPMIVLQFWKDSRLHAQNVWRAWMLAHSMPRPGGNLPPVPQLAACSSHQFGEMINANTENQKLFIDKYLERGMKLEYWWMDAGWYYNKTGWPHTGTWEVDQDRFPGGLRPISDHAHGRDVDIIVWFEPERVAADTWLTKNHPEWIHGGEKGGLLNLGNKDAWTWLVNHVDKLITEQGIDLYRQDFNMDPLPHWQANDTEDRQGITEIRHVEGYLAYWDELIRRHPNMLIDSCASGGRRNDLETLRRAVPLLRSDYIMEPTGNQCHGYVLPLWFPFFGTGTSKTGAYEIRSTLCPHFTACWDQREDTIDWTGIKRIVDQWKAWAPNYYGDYYPLTPYSLENTDWLGWQFHRPEAGKGMVQMFRRPDSPYSEAQLPLFALDPDAEYEVASIDEPERKTRYSGKALLEKGLTLSLAGKPSAAVYTYEKI
ncbi:MAG TPA: NPCBM/NEW2 domain-containing protein [Candidatus Hydrogenedentes bacterium]|nr:NPCBM/NEW2 domain-containing protein [Candidatus Hydrogenedentota bacterium]